MPARNDTIALISFAAGIAALDQFTKSAVLSSIAPALTERRIDIVDGWIGIEYAENRGAAFGLLAGLAPVLAMASIAVLAGILIHFARQAQPPLWQTVAVGAIAGGAIGNLSDRIRLGFVVDFVSIGPWPRFNVADSAITFGVLVLIWHWLRSDVGYRGARAVDVEG